MGAGKEWRLGWGAEAVFRNLHAVTQVLGESGKRGATAPKLQRGEMENAVFNPTILQQSY